MHALPLHRGGLDRNDAAPAGPEADEDEDAAVVTISGEEVVSALRRCAVKPAAAPSRAAAPLCYDKLLPDWRADVRRFGGIMGVMRALRSGVDDDMTPTDDLVVPATCLWAQADSYTVRPCKLDPNLKAPGFKDST